MAEALGVAASALQLAGAGAKLTTLIYSITTTVRGASKDLESIAVDISITSSVLKQLGTLLQQHDAASFCSQGGLTTTNNALISCQRAYDDVSSALEAASKKRSDGRVAMSSKLLWPLKQERIQSFQANLERLKSTLTLMLSVLLYASKDPRNTSSQEDDRRKDKAQIEALIQTNREATKRFELLMAKLGIDPSSPTTLQKTPAPSPHHVVTTAKPSQIPAPFPLLPTQRKQIKRSNTSPINNKNKPLQPSLTSDGLYETLQRCALAVEKLNTSLQLALASNVNHQSLTPNMSRELSSNLTVSLNHGDDLLRLLSGLGNNSTPSFHKFGHRPYHPPRTTTKRQQLASFSSSDDHDLPYNDSSHSLDTFLELDSEAFSFNDTTGSLEEMHVTGQISPPNIQIDLAGPPTVRNESPEGINTELNTYAFLESSKNSKYSRERSSSRQRLKGKGLSAAWNKIASVASLSVNKKRKNTITGQDDTLLEAQDSLQNVATNKYTSQQDSPVLLPNKMSDTGINVEGTTDAPDWTFVRDDDDFESLLSRWTKKA